MFAAIHLSRPREQLRGRGGTIAGRASIACSVNGIRWNDSGVAKSSSDSETAQQRQINMTIAVRSRRGHKR
jgi:hypothetical protein